MQSADTLSLAIRLSWADIQIARRVSYYSSTLEHLEKCYNATSSAAAVVVVVVVVSIKSDVPWTQLVFFSLLPQKMSRVIKASAS